jgi:hypothetical protein
MSSIPSPLPVFTTLTRAERTWLYQLWQSTGGSTTTANDFADDIAALDLRVDVLETNQVLTKQTTVDVGSTYVQDANINVIDADITVNSLVMAQITPVGATYTRAPEEVIYERIIVFCTPKSGSVDFYLNPERGHIKGQFLINYTVTI